MLKYVNIFLKESGEILKKNEVIKLELISKLRTHTIIITIQKRLNFSHINK